MNQKPRFSSFSSSSRNSASFFPSSSICTINPCHRVSASPATSEPRRCTVTNNVSLATSSWYFMLWFFSSVKFVEQRARRGSGGKEAEHEESIARNTHGILSSKGFASLASQVQHAGSDTGGSFSFSLVLCTRANWHGHTLYYFWRLATWTRFDVSLCLFQVVCSIEKFGFLCRQMESVTQQDRIYSNGKKREENTKRPCFQHRTIERLVFFGLEWNYKQRSNIS